MNTITEKIITKQFFELNGYEYDQPVELEELTDVMTYNGNIETVNFHRIKYGKPVYIYVHGINSEGINPAVKINDSFIAICEKCPFIVSNGQARIIAYAEPASLEEIRHHDGMILGEMYTSPTATNDSHTHRSIKNTAADIDIIAFKTFNGAPCRFLHGGASGVFFDDLPDKTYVDGKYIPVMGDTQ